MLLYQLFECVSHIQRADFLSLVVMKTDKNGCET